MVIFVFWIVFSILVGAIGSGRKIGFAGAFFCALLLSPLIGIIIALVSSPNPQEVQPPTIIHAPLPSSPPASIAEELDKLHALLTDGKITQEDYDALKKKLLA